MHTYINAYRPPHYPQAQAYFFGLSSDLEFFLNKIFFPIIKINRLPSITMEAQAVARDQHLINWPDGSACPLGLSFWLSSWLLCYWSVHESTFDNPADDTHVSIYILRDCCMATVSLIL